MFTNERKKEIKSAIDRLSWLYLDTHYHGWHWDIDLEKFDLHDCYHCIAGQLEPDYFVFVNKLRKYTLNESFISNSIAPGYTYDSYASKQWTRQIKSRRRKDRIRNFKNKLVSWFKRH